MQTHAAAPDPEDVLQHLEWVRGLALRIVGDPAEADDLRQEVWILSQRLQRPGRIPLEGWLRGLLRNILRDRRRSETTRDYHEQSAALERARSDASPPAVREASLHQVVVERLMDLREPYRSTLLARYFEKLSHAEIALREGVTVAAVRSRIQRGLGELRQDLAADRRDGRSVLALLALHTWDRADIKPVAAAQAAWIPAAIIGVTAAAAGLLVWSQTGPTRTPAAAGADASGPTEARVESPAPEAALRSPDSRTAMDDASGATGAPAAKSPRRVRVEVVDLTGEKVPGVEVQLLIARPGTGFDPGPTAQTDASGGAELEVGDAIGMVACVTPPGYQLSAPNVHEELRPGDALTIVLAERTELAGAVRDPEGQPLEGVTLDLEFLARFPDPIGRFMDHANLMPVQATTGPEGRFRVDVPRSAVPMGLVARKVGFDPVLRADLDLRERPAPMELVLSPVSSPRGCYGRVVADTGEPVEGAWVGDGERVVRADADGVFQLGPVPAGADLLLGAPGHAPRLIEPSNDLRGITLELNGGALTISGTVRRTDGATVAGLEIRPAPLRPAGRYFYPHGGRLAFTDLFVESFGLPSSGAFPPRPLATTDADGHFVLRGLLPRDYDLVLVDPRTLQRETTQPFAAGTTNIDLKFPSSPAPVDGVVRTPSGEPLPAVRVRSFAGDVAFLQGPMTRTDAEGRFHFDGLAQGTRVMADTELPWVHVGAAVGAAGPLELQVEPGARVVITIDLKAMLTADGRFPKALLFRDEGGRTVPLITDDLLFYRHERLALTPDAYGNATPGPLLVPTRARTLVLVDGDTDLRQIPLDLEPGAEIRLTE